MAFNGMEEDIETLQRYAEYLKDNEVIGWIKKIRADQCIYTDSILLN